MGKPAARLTDMHICPMVTPGLPPIPHVGGPIAGPGCPTVLIGGMPASVMGDICVCVGPPDSIVMGSTGVFFGGVPAARMGDPTAHGGSVILGLPTVLIGEVGSGSAAPPVGSSGGASGLSSVADHPALQAAVIQSSAFATVVSRILALQQGAAEGAPFVHKHNDEDNKVQYRVISEYDDREVREGVRYVITTTDGKTFEGKTDSSGMTVEISGYTSGMCSISFPD